MDGRLEREWQLLRSPSVLVANGILLFDEDQHSECGRLVFWLGELPQYTLFTTENGTSVERIKTNKVRLRFPFSKDEKLIDVPPKPRELSGGSGAKHTRSVSDSSAHTTSLSFSSFSSNPQLPSTTTRSTSAAAITFDSGGDVVERQPAKTSWWARFSSGSSVTVATAAATTTHAERSPRSAPPSAEQRPASKREQAPRGSKKLVSDGVGKLAENEDIQEKGGALLARLAQDKGVQSMVGDALAESSDNSFLAKMARNPKVQEKIASKVSAAATNKTVQKKVGKMVKDFAENEDAQKRAAGFLGSMIKAAASRD